MKCGIITLFGTNNYGNRLQNYAVEQILLELGAKEVSTYVITVSEDHMLSIGALRKLIPARLYTLYDFISEVLSGKMVMERSEQFKNFNHDYIHVKKIFAKSYKELCRNKEIQEKDFFIVGSDQVWNPGLTMGVDQYFLKFVPYEKRIALCASIGSKELKKQYIELFKQGIDGMKYISVREEAAKDIIKQFSNQAVDLFLDPTFLITIEKWYALIKKPACPIPPKYILSFFLNKEPQTSIHLCQNKIHCDIVYLNNKNYEYFYALGPSEFLYMIKNAEMILTDSFHATVFSILFHKQFYVYPRKQKDPQYMFTRFDTLLTKFSLSDRVQDRDNFKEKTQISEKQYYEIDDMIKTEQEKVRIILNKVFNGEQL